MLYSWGIRDNVQGVSKITTWPVSVITTLQKHIFNNFLLNSYLCNIHVVIGHRKTKGKTFDTIMASRL